MFGSQHDLGTLLPVIERNLPTVPDVLMFDGDGLEVVIVALRKGRKFGLYFCQSLKESTPQHSN
jgi:hypothetical protein